MTDTLFKLVADYDTCKSILFSTDEMALRMFGKDHHSAATIKPEMTITNPEGKVIAERDVWAVEWKEV